MKNSLLVKVTVAIVLAVIAGWITGPEMAIFGVPFVKIYNLIGQLFLNALNLIVVPLVAASIITGTARMGGETVGNLGAKAFGYYVLTSACAVLVGLGGFLLFSPGQFVDHPAILSNTSESITALAAQSQGDTFERISQILYKIVPSNIFAVASQGQMLGIIGFSILFGFFMTKIDAHASSIVSGFWNGIFQIMMKITHVVMKALPIGVFGLVAKVIATTGLDSITSVALFFATATISLLFYSTVVLPLLLVGIAGVNPILHFRAMAPALFTAFCTSSSAATLPLSMECVEKRAGVSNRICSFSLPLGTSLNMSGCALYICVTSLFIAQVYGVDLSVTNLALIAAMSLLTSMGIAGIPSASLISVVVILHTVGVPAEGIGLIMAVERFLDMMRTSVNVLGNTTCAVLIAKSEGETGVLAASPAEMRS